jgi:hypothetical protein
VTEAVHTRLDSTDEIHAVLGIAFNPWYTSGASIAITDEQVVFFTRTILGRLNTADGGVATFPIESVTLIEWTRKSRWSRLKLQRPDGIFDLRVDRVHREEAERLASLISPTPRA